MPNKSSDPSDHGMIKPKKRSRADRQAKSSVEVETKPSKKPRSSKPKNETKAEKPKSESAPQADEKSSSRRRSRRKPKVMPKSEMDPAATSEAMPVDDASEKKADKPARSRKRPSRQHEAGNGGEESRSESKPKDEHEESDDKPKRRRRRGGRGRKRNNEGAEETGIQSRDGDESDNEDRNEGRRESRRSRDERSDDDGDDKPRRSRRRRGGRGRRSRDGEERSEEARSDNRRERDERPAKRSDDGPVSFDPDAEFDPDVFAEKTYDKLPIRNSVLKGIHACGFNRPTHIQDRLIPVALDGKDVLGQAKTGTGKTAAFSIPALCMAERGVAFQTIILAPTRELAIQISAEIAALGGATPIKCAAVYGGQAIPIQKKKLQENPEIIVATPGRLMDMYEHRNLHFKNVRQVILDEVDRMLDIGFRDDIKKILGNIKTDHQTIFVSATISDEIEKLAKNFMTDPERLTLTAGALTVQLVDQHYVPCENWYKRRMLLHLLKHEDPELTIVFCRTKATVDRVAKFLHDKRVDTQAIHGDMPQGKRNSVMKKLRGGHLSVLVASDLAARGLDVDDITHVINYDVPEDPEVYVHRIGRTARAGRRGHAWTFVLPDQGELLTQIEHLTNVEITRLEYEDFEPGEPPADIREERKKKKESKERAEKMVSRLAGPDVPKKADQNDPRFPGGVVPTKLPPKMARGKVNTTRGMKQMRAAELKDKKVEE